jgi:hypothetical protein
VLAYQCVQVLRVQLKQVGILLMARRHAQRATSRKGQHAPP